MNEANRKKQEELFLEYHDKVQHYIYTKVSNPTVAEDLTSTVFLKVYQKFDAFDETKSKISTWIYTIANNTVIDYYRTSHPAEEVPETLQDASCVEDEVLGEIELEELACALERLPERERDLLILHYYKELTLKEVALRLGMSYANVKIVHNKALTQLQNIMKSQ